MRATSSASTKPQSRSPSRPPSRRRFAFSVGASLPTLAAFLAPNGAVVIVVPAAALVFLVALGALGARLGGAPMFKAAVRVGFWGALAMAVTAGVGALIGN